MPQRRIWGAAPGPAQSPLATNPDRRRAYIEKCALSCIEIDDLTRLFGITQEEIEGLSGRSKKRISKVIQDNADKRLDELSKMEEDKRLALLRLQSIYVKSLEGSGSLGHAVSALRELHTLQGLTDNGAEATGYDTPETKRELMRALMELDDGDSK